MKYKDFEKLILILKESSFVPFSKKIAKLTSKTYCDFLDSGVSSEESMLNAVSVAASLAFRESIMQSLLVALEVESERPLSREELRSLLKVIRSDD